VSYPADWQVSTSSLQDEIPSIVFGNPIEGTTTYTVRISIAQNNNGLSSSDYVKDMLGKLTTADAANGTNTPQISAQFASSTAFSVDDNQKFELDDVFEFDHDAEQIYAAHSDEVVVFDFPVADQNPNLSLPADNNAIAHEMLGTLTFVK
jgi:hypothetical protein